MSITDSNILLQAFYANQTQDQSHRHKRSRKSSYDSEDTSSVASDPSVPFEFDQQQQTPKKSKTVANLESKYDRVEPVFRVNANGQKERVFVCPLAGCNASFNTRFSLKRHRKKHTGERPYVCDAAGCGRRFAEKSTLKRHLRTHSGDRPFRCSYTGCNKTFADRPNARRHYAVHKDAVAKQEEYCEPAFPCPTKFCRKLFKTPNKLERHVRQEHEEVAAFQGSLGLLRLAALSASIWEKSQSEDDFLPIISD